MLKAASPDPGPGGRFQWRIAVGWGMGGALLSAVDFAKVLLLGYLVDFVGVSAIVAGGMIAICKIYDAAIDPLIGVLSDKTHSRWGRRRPYLLIGGLACGFAYFFMFHVPMFRHSNETLSYVFLSLIVYATAYAVFSVPYKAMSAEITDDYNARTTLTSIGTVFFSLGAMVGTSTAPTLIGLYGGGRTGHESMSIVMALSTCVVGLTCFFLTRGAYSRTPTAVVKGAKRREIWSVFLTNGPFVILTVSTILRGLAVALMNGAAVFYVRRVLRVGDIWLGQLFLILTAALILSLPAWIWISRRVGKKGAYLIGIMLIVPAQLSWLWAAGHEPFWIFFLRNVATGLGSGSLIAMSQSMLPDTMEYDRRKTGLHREGIFAGFSTTVDKATVALGIASVGVVLGMTGYISARTPDVVQPKSAILGIELCFAVIPAVLLLASGVILLFYKVTQTSLKQMHTVDIAGLSIQELAI